MMMMIIIIQIICNLWHISKTLIKLFYLNLKKISLMYLFINYLLIFSVLFCLYAICLKIY